MSKKERTVLIGGLITCVLFPALLGYWDAATAGAAGILVLLFGERIEQRLLIGC